MEVKAEQEINWFGKKEKVKVIIDVPVPPNKTKQELIEEFGDIGFADKNSEQVMQEVFGSIANKLSCFLTASLYMGMDSGVSLMILEQHINRASIETLEIIEMRKETEKNS